MEVTIERQQGQDARLSIKLQPADYQSELEQTLNDYRKKVNVPGFRPGKAPIGMVRKMIGKDAKREIVEKTMQRAVQEYVKENNLKLLLNPLSAYEAEDINWADDEFQFRFDIGIRPELNLDMEALNNLSRYQVNITDEEVNEEVENLRQQNAKFEDQETLAPDADNYVMVRLAELDEEGNRLEGGATGLKRFAYNDIPAALRPVLEGQAKGFKTNIVAADIFSADELAEMFRLDANGVKDLNPNFELEIVNVFQMQLPELNEEFFSKFGAAEPITTVEEFRVEWRKAMENFFGQEADKILAAEVRDALMQNTRFELPEEFLDKYLLMMYEKKSADELPDYDKKRSDMHEEVKWMMIAEQVQEQQDIQVTEEEVVEYTVAMLNAEFARMGYPGFDEDFMRKYADDYLRKENNFNRTALALRDGKVFEYLLSQISPKTQEIDLKGFQEIRNKR